MKLDEIVNTIERDICENYGLDLIDIKWIHVLFPNLYFDLDSHQRYHQYDDVFNGDWDTFRTKIRDAVNKNHDFENCFNHIFECHSKPLMVVIDVKENQIERYYYID